MRINTLGIRTIPNRYSKAEVQAPQSPAMTNSIKGSELSSLPHYPVLNISFKGYEQDKELLQSTERFLNNSLSRVVDYYQKQNETFISALTVLKNKNPELYEKFTEDKNLFKQYNLYFENLENTTFGALDEVRGSYTKTLTKFWEENSSNANVKTAEVIKKSLKLSDNESISKAIKDCSFGEYETLKNDIAYEVLTSLINEKPKDFIDEIKEENNELMQKLSEKISYGEAKRYFDSLKANFYEDFANCTINKIFNNSSTKETKTEAVLALTEYLEKVLTTEKPEQLKADLNDILKVQKNLKTAINKENFDYAKEDFRTLYNIAINYWKENDLPFLINDVFKKENYIVEAEKQNKEIHKFQNYDGLSTNQKYFVLKYYDFKKDMFNDNDFLKQMINDRNIDDPAVIIDLMSATIDNQKITYFENLDNFHEFLTKRKYDKSLEIPKKTAKNPKDKLSFLNTYLYLLDKLDNYQIKSDETKLEYLSTLTKDELRLLANKIKQQWVQDDLKFVTEAAVRKQANLTSINKKMYDELVKVNLNLNDIKIKLNDVTCTLKDLLEYRQIVKNPNEAQKIAQNASSIIADSERAYEKMSKEQKSNVDDTLRKTLPTVIDNLIHHTNDEQTIKELEELRKKCKGSMSPTRDSFEMIKAVVLGRTVSIGLQKGGHMLSNLSQLAAPRPEDILASQAVSIAGVAAGSEKTMGATATMFSPDPMSIAIIVALAAIATVAVGTHNAKQLEKNQNELFFPFGD